MPRHPIAVVLPAYNETLTIEGTLREFHAVLPDAWFVVVDNNSKDDTGDKARKTLADLGAKGEVLLERAQGKGRAVRRAFKDVDADIYVLTDADTTYPAEAAPRLIELVTKNQADMVVGDRITAGQYEKENKRPFHSFGNGLVKWLVNRFFGAQMRDVMSGYRVMTREFVKTYPILVQGFQLETDMTLHALDKRFRVAEVPVEYRDRPAGSFSKLSTVSDGARVIVTIAQILRYYRPMFFFGGLAFLTALAGLIAAIPVFDDWFTHRYIYHVPLAILASGLELVAVVGFGVGLILDSINHQYRMTFERSLLREDVR